MRFLLGKVKEPNILSSTEGLAHWGIGIQKVVFCLYVRIAGHQNAQISLSSVTDLMSAYGICLDHSYITEPYC